MSTKARTLGRYKLVAVLAAVVGALAFPGAALAHAVTISSSAEGSIKISNGDFVAAGYQFTIPGSHPDTHVLISSATVTITGPCSNGGSDTLTIPLAAGPYDDPPNSSGWYPSGPLGEDDPASYQGSVQANVCGGSGTLDASAGAIFHADVQADQTGAALHIQFHYRDPNAKGKGNVNCQTATNPPAAVCGASWSGTESVIPDAETPAFTIEKLQHIFGGFGSFTKSELTGEVGQIVDYEMIVKNTGNTTLTFENFTDAHCDAGTIAGGPGASAIAPGESTTYTCEHTLTLADQTAGRYENNATDTGRPPEGTPITHTSNTVVVTIPSTPPPPVPGMTIEKLQKIDGSGSFTTAPLTGAVGQTVDYEIIVKDTGNTVLTLSGFSDPHCDAGTLAGGSASLAPGEATTYTCRHVLATADQIAGHFENTAVVTGTPPDGPPVSHTSNTVIVNVPTPPKVSVSPLIATAPPKVSVSPLIATAPALKGPQGCVRHSFPATVKAAGVKSVTFYLDGHKLKTLSAKNAHGGQLTLTVNTAKLKVGAHKLVAKVTMNPTSVSVKPALVKRTLMVLRCASSVVNPKFTG
jgi:hypothetical protein